MNLKPTICGGRGKISYPTEEQEPCKSLVPTVLAPKDTDLVIPCE